MSAFDPKRRSLLKAGTVALGAIIVTGGTARAAEESSEKDVGAVEDLMREHGVLRRAFLVLSESVPKLRADAGSVDAAALNRVAKLFHEFGEEYHERKLEEAYIFPKVKASGGVAAAYVDVLVAQHDRGREIIRFITDATSRARVAAADVEPMCRAMESFALMYANHAAREDTIVFPAWKSALSGDELDEIGDKFEDIEKAQFGHAGFESAVAEIGRIETALGFADLAQFTAPAPR